MVDQPHSPQPDRPPDLQQVSLQESITELLCWYRDIGVDIALGDEPVDHFALFKQQAESCAQKRNEMKQSMQEDRIKDDFSAGNRRKSPDGLTFSQQGRQVQSRTANNSGQMADAAIPDDNAITNARELVKTATSRVELRQIMAEYKGCNLRLSAKNLVFCDGNPEAKIMLVGEAPGREEDRHGLPFIGRSGQLLDRMLAAIGLTRESVYISNVIPWRPPGNRTPTPQETEICRPFIERHIELINPDILILLGGASSKVLLNSTEGILKMRGRWNKYQLNEREIDAIPTLHPAYLLRQPAQKKLSWQDLLMIKAKICENRLD